MKTGSVNQWNMIARTVLCGAVALLWAFPVNATVLYEVGDGQTYSTIQAALNAVPTGSAFTESHVVNIHEGTYTGKFDTPVLAEPTFSNRLVIQAVEGDNVTVNQNVAGFNGASFVRTENVTIQGLNFTGRSGANEWYLDYNVYGDGAGGLMVYNNEFSGGPVARFRNENTTAGTVFSYALVQNYIHDLDANAIVALGHSGDTEKELFAGNVIANINNGGGTLVSVQTPSGYDNRWIVNNTYASGDTVPSKAMLTLFGTDFSGVTIANNLIFQDPNGANKDIGVNFQGGGSAISDYGTIANNLQYDQGQAIHTWGRVNDDVGNQDFATLALFNAYLNSLTVSPGELNGIDNINPLLQDTASGIYNPDHGSPVLYAGDVSYWNAAIADLGIGSFLAAYFNSARNPGYDFTHSNIGALALPEPSTVFLMVIGGGMLWRWTRRRRG